MVSFNTTGLKIKPIVHTGDVFDDIEDHVERGIKAGRTALSRELEEVAQERIREAGAIWKGELIDSFDTDIYREGSKFVLVFKNDAEHAAPIEFGAEYTDRGPPVAALIPWVQTQLRGISIPEDDLPAHEDVERIREEARDEALNQNMIDAASLAEPATIRKAFWLQQYIKEHGIDAVRFMKAAEVWAEQEGSDTIAKFIKMNLGQL